MNGTVIEFAKLILADLLIHLTKRLGILGGDHDTSRVTVDSVAQRGSEGLLGIGIVFTLLIQICLDVHDQCIVRALRILVYQHTGTLVAQDDIFILIGDRQLGLDAGKCPHILLGRVKELIANKELDRVALLQNIALLGTRTIYLDLFGADVFVHQRHGKPLDGLG